MNYIIFHVNISKYLAVTSNELVAMETAINIHKVLHKFMKIQ